MDRFKVRLKIRVAGMCRLKAEVIQRTHNQQLDNFVGLLVTNSLPSSQGQKHTKKCGYMSIPGVDFEPMIRGFWWSKYGHATDRITKQN